MLKNRSVDRAAVYGWLILLVIPFLVMGWTIGRYGPGSDVWVFLNRFYHGNFSTWDPPRPFHPYSEALLYLIAGGRLPVIQVLYCLLESISAALYFEVLRRVLQRWLGRVGIFAALLTSLVYVLYPSYADRLYMMMIQDSTNRILTTGIALLWVVGSEKDQPRYGVIGAGLMIITLLHKENSTLVFGLFPLIALYYGRALFQGRWRTATALWWGALGGYVVWHVLPPALGGVSGIMRSVQFTDPWGAIVFLASSLKNITLGAYQLAFVESPAELQQLGWGWVLPAALIGAGLIVAGGWLVSRRDVQAEPARVSLRPWGLLCLFGIAWTLLGLILFYLQLGHPTPISGMESRNTTMAMMGVSLIGGLIILFPMLATRQLPPPGSGPAGPSASRLRLWRNGGLALSGLLGALLLAGGVLRQFRMDIAFIDAWQTQRAYWQRITELELTLHPNTLLVMDSFPRVNHGAPLASSNWGFSNAFELLYEAPPNVNVINNGEVDHPHIAGDTLTISVYGVKSTYQLEDVRVLYYDAATQSVEIEPHLPLSWTSDRVYITTGDNPSQTPAPMSQYNMTLLGAPIPPGVCWTKVPVHTSDQAPTNGVVEVATYPQNVVIDRRQVSQGTLLDFSIRAPCGSWIRVYFDTRDGAGAGSYERLVSQYGAGQEYGTAEEATSPTYATTFGQAVPAKALH